MKGLLNHCGAQRVSFDDLKKLPEPEPLTPTHYPLRHDAFVNECLTQLGKYGWEVSTDERGEKNMDFSLIQSFDKDRWSKEMKPKDTMFGVICLKSEFSDYEPTIGLRNSNTMHSKARFAFGDRVFVCDNMCFFGEEQFERKHTKNIYDDLPKLVAGKISKARGHFEKHNARVAHYKTAKIGPGRYKAFDNVYELNEEEDVIDVILGRATGKGIILDKGHPTREKRVSIPGGNKTGWRTNYFTGSGHLEFLRNDFWALQNAFTEEAKKWGAIGGLHQERTRAVTMILDEFSGFNRVWEAKQKQAQPEVIEV